MVPAETFTAFLEKITKVLRKFSVFFRRTVLPTPSRRASPGFTCPRPTAPQNVTEPMSLSAKIILLPVAPQTKRTNQICI